MTIYVLHPGVIHSQADGEVHRVSCGDLCRLYKVPKAAKTIDATAQQALQGIDKDVTLVHLYPSSIGRYYDVNRGW